MAFLQKIYSGLVLGSVLGTCLVSQSAGATDESSEVGDAVASSEVSDVVVTAENSEIMLGTGATMKAENDGKRQGEETIEGGALDGVASVSSTSDDPSTEDSESQLSVDITGNIEGSEDQQSLQITEDDSNAEANTTSIDGPADSVQGEDVAASEDGASVGSTLKYLIAGISGAAMANGTYIFTDKLLNKKK